MNTEPEISIMNIDRSEFEIKISASKKYIYINVKVDISINLAKEITQEAYKIAEVLKIERMLFDVRGSRNIDPVVENFKFAYHFLPDPEERRFKKIANLITPHDESHNNTVAFLISRGYNIKEFWVEEEAVAYLEKPDF